MGGGTDIQKELEEKSESGGGNSSIHHWMPEYWEVRASARNVSPEKPIEEGLHSLIKDRL